MDRVVVREHTYFDSVTLMQASQEARAVEGVGEVAAVSATPANLAMVGDLGFDVGDRGLSPDDLLVAVRADDDHAAQEAVQALNDALSAREDGADDDGRPGRAAAPSLAAAARRDAELSLALVSVPGRHADYEVAVALEAGMHVFCFSDGISLEHEAALKRRAVERGLLLMGADCGTAILDGVGLGFSNAVRRGPVGLVGASGTGLQELACLLDAAGVGISQAIGVGGRDLKDVVGGTMTTRALELLADDDATEVVVVVSKPPDPGVAATVADAAGRTGKPTLLAFPGVDEPPPRMKSVEFSGSLEAAAARVAELRGGTLTDLDEPVAPGVAPGDVRGLFAGGTLCTEAMAVVSRAVGRVASNVPLRPEWRLDGVESAGGHAFIDFGEDVLTERRPHPMIDPTFRNERFEAEAADPDVGVVLVDVVLGYCAHDDPAGALAPLVERALRDRPDGLRVVVTVCGARDDPQGTEGQVGRLRDAGAAVTRSAAAAARHALTAAGLSPDPRGQE